MKNSKKDKAMESSWGQALRSHCIKLQIWIFKWILVIPGLWEVYEGELWPLSRANLGLNLCVLQEANLEGWVTKAPWSPADAGHWDLMFVLLDFGLCFYVIFSPLYSKILPFWITKIYAVPWYAGNMHFLILWEFTVKKIWTFKVLEL